MSAEPVLECRCLTVAYDRDVVLDRIDLVVPRGALLPFVGPNGAGKTTLLRACLGLIPYQGGRIMRAFGSHPPAYVPQQRQIDNIYPITVRDIVTMGLYPELGYWRRPNSEQRERVERVIERFKLHPHRHKHFGELSGGLRQKTLLARAVVAQSEVLVLDEPMAGLDAAAEKDMLTQIRSLHQEGGRTVLWVHHRFDQCTELADQVCRVDQQGVQIMPAAEMNI